MSVSLKAYKYVKSTLQYNYNKLNEATTSSQINSLNKRIAKQEVKLADMQANIQAQINELQNGLQNAINEPINRITKEVPVKVAKPKVVKPKKFIGKIKKEEEKTTVVKFSDVVSVIDTIEYSYNMKSVEPVAEQIVIEIELDEVIDEETIIMQSIKDQLDQAQCEDDVLQMKRKLALQYHPDKNNGDSTIMNLINAHIDILVESFRSEQAIAVAAQDMEFDEYGCPIDTFSECSSDSDSDDEDDQPIVDTTDYDCIDLLYVCQQEDTFNSACHIWQSEYDRIYNESAHMINEQQLQLINTKYGSKWALQTINIFYDEIVKQRQEKQAIKDEEQRLLQLSYDTRRKCFYCQKSRREIFMMNFCGKQGHWCCEDVTIFRVATVRNALNMPPITPEQLAKYQNNYCFKFGLQNGLKKHSLIMDCGLCEFQQIQMVNDPVNIIKKYQNDIADMMDKQHEDYQRQLFELNCNKPYEPKPIIYDAEAQARLDAWLNY